MEDMTLHIAMVNPMASWLKRGVSTKHLPGARVSQNATPLPAPPCFEVLAYFLRGGQNSMPAIWLKYS